MISSEFGELEQRIDNWRHHFHTGQKINCVSHYVPTKGGNLIYDDLPDIHKTPELREAIARGNESLKNSMGRMPVDMYDAELLEMTWQRMPDQAKKTYIKLEKIDRMSNSTKGCFIMWRKMRKFGVKISSFEAHEAYNRAVMAYFDRQLRA